MKSGPNDLCPCWSGRKLKRCCMPLHEGAPAPSPEALMRSRYAAYARGLVDYVVATTDPAGPQHRADLEGWRAEIRAFCRRTSFDGLQILDQETEGDVGFVSFRATLSRDGQDVSMGERSRFRRVGGRWLYTDGVPL